jgi:hypothetical protein
MNNCPGAGDMEELLTPNVLNFLPLSKVKNAFPVVEISCTVMLLQPLKHEGRKAALKIAAGLIDEETP